MVKQSQKNNSLSFEINLNNKPKHNKIKRFSHSSLFAKRHWYDLEYGKEKIRLSFHEHNVDDRFIKSADSPELNYRSFKLKPLTNSSLNSDFLNWLGVLFGQDMFDVRSIQYESRPEIRGRIIFNQKHAQYFLNKAYDWQTNNLKDEWQAEVFNAAIGTYHIALAGGLNHTPISQSLFLTCLENLANVYNYDPSSRRSASQKLGPKCFFNDSSDDRLLDFEALLAIRNITGFHFGAHQQRERKKLRDALAHSFGRHNNFPPEFIEASFQPDRILHDIHREAHWLFLLGLGLCREAFTKVIGASGTLVAENDFYPYILNTENASEIYP